MFLTGEGRGLLGKVFLPVAVCTNVLFVLVDVTVDDVIAVGTAERCFERQIQYLVMLTQKPSICFSTCQTCAVNTGLLSGTYTDGLSVNGIANRVGLRIFESDERDDEITHSTFGEIFVFGYDIRKQLTVDFKVVSALLKGDAKHLLGFLNGRNVVGIDLYDVVASLSLALEDFKRFGFISGSDNTVGNLALNKERGGNVANVGEGYPVAKGTHTVGAARSCVSASQGRLVKTFDIINEASLFQLFGKRNADCRRGGADVLERGNCRESERGFEFLNELPRVESIEEVDVTGSATQNFDGKLASILHINLCRLLIGVTTVFEFKFFHFASPHTFLFTILVSLSPLAMSM